VLRCGQEGTVDIDDATTPHLQKRATYPRSVARAGYQCGFDVPPTHSHRPRVNIEVIAAHQATACLCCLPAAVILEMLRPDAASLNVADRTLAQPSVAIGAIGPSSAAKRTPSVH
jgi:hypothetical protein